MSSLTYKQRNANIQQRSILVLYILFWLIIVVSIGVIRNNQHDTILLATGFAVVSATNSNNKKRMSDTISKLYQSSSNGSNKMKKSSKASTNKPANKGFGSSSQETFDDIVSKFRTRIPITGSDVSCPCGLSNESYANCCQPFHQGIRQAETPLQVLQTRYAAFVYRIVPYVIQTTHPNHPDYRTNPITWAKTLNQAGMFDSYEFVGLCDIQQEPQEDSEAYISFTVRLRPKGTNQETIIKERSQFLQSPHDGQWLYASGDVRTE